MLNANTLSFNDAKSTNGVVEMFNACTSVSGVASVHMSLFPPPKQEGLASQPFL